MGWRPIEFGDVPSREEFENLTLKLVRRGITNSEEMRTEIRKERKLILQKSTHHWNQSPSGKFVNEHAWALENLVVRKIIKKISEKEYRLLQTT